MAALTARLAFRLYSLLVRRRPGEAPPGDLQRGHTSSAVRRVSYRFSGTVRTTNYQVRSKQVFGRSEALGMEIYGLIEHHPIRFAFACLRMIVGWGAFFALAVCLKRYR